MTAVIRGQMGKYAIALFLGMALLAFGGCAGLHQQDASAKSAGQKEPAAAAAGNGQGISQDFGEAKDVVAVSAKSGTDDGEEEDFYYAYTALGSQQERQLYKEILHSLLALEKETELSVLDTELVDSVFQCVMADHPEIFYVDGYTTTVYRLGSVVKRMVFRGGYTMGKEEIQDSGARMEERIQEWLAGAPAGDDYETVKYLYEYLILHTEYELGCADNQNIRSVLLNGKSVCQGYAKTFQLLCQRMGIGALLVTGKIGGQRHGWNMVCMDGQWYHVDPTWGDASYRQAEAGYPQTAFPVVNYECFGLTTQQMEETHVLEEGQYLPECTSVKNAYYRREGLFLETADWGRLSDIFQKARQQGSGMVTFQCADDAVYAQVYDMLIEEQRIFELLPPDEGKAAYADSPKKRILSFWM